MLDAYLDGDLSGSLRLEFDAHRLRCRRCQSQLSMLEAVGTVLASRSQPEMSADFADRVMAGIGAPRRQKTISRRVAVWSLVGLQAAAVLAFALFVWPLARSAAPVLPDGSPVAASRSGAPDGVDLHEAYYGMIVGKLEAASRNVTVSFGQLAQYPLAAQLPDEVARASSDAGSVNPWLLLLRGMLAPEPDSAEGGAPSDELYSL